MAPKKKNIGVKAAKSAVSPKGTRTLDFHVGAYDDDEDENHKVDWGGMAEAEKEQETLLEEMLEQPASKNNAAELAKKYGVDFDESDSEDSLLDDLGEKDSEPANPLLDKLSSMSKEEVVQEALAIHDELKEQKQETRKLGTLLEGLEPIPGLDPERLLDVMEGTEVVDRDYRDVKIVQLAKKVRNLNVSRNAEKGRADKWKKQLTEAETEIAKLREELDKMASPAARAAALRTQQQQHQAGGESPASKGGKDQQKAAILQHQVDDLKRKLYSQDKELKKVQRALQKELGDGNISMEDALEDGWRGRAQQIVMLKAKIKRLEAGGASGVPRRRRDDVDTRAQEDLQDMEKQRQITMEQLTLDLQSTAEEAEKHKKRFDAAKARTRVLEQENTKLKDSVKVLVGKTDTDNQLIDALRDELKSLQKRVASGQNTLQEAGTRIVSQQRDGDAMEIAHLKATIKRQADQIDRQGHQLQQLRSELHAYKSRSTQEDQYNW